MKKRLAILVSVLAIVGLLAACGTSGDAAGEGEGGIVLENPVLFENGEWNPELGEIRAVMYDGENGTFENGVYFSNQGSGWRFFFENPVDASMYRRLVIEAEENTQQMGWWGGGQLINFVAEAFEDDGEMTNYVSFGFWQGDVHANQRITLSFRGSMVNDLRTRHRFTPSSLAGFSAKVSENGGQLTITRVFLE